jgi:S-adenosylmethionine/arginine decarboxylase-like enzyme
MKPWGYHLILDCSGCNDSIQDKEAIKSFVDELIPAIGMKAFGEPIIEHFAQDNHDACGYSLMQFIETSSITAHFAENLGEAYIDIFSCKYFSEDDAIRLVVKYFGHADITLKYFDKINIKAKFLKRGKAR